MSTAPTVVGTNSSQSETQVGINCALPAGVQKGDIVFCWIMARGGGVSTSGYAFTAAPGYTRIGLGAHDGAVISAQAFYKVLTAADTSTGSFLFQGQAAGQFPAGQLLLAVVRGGKAYDAYLYANSANVSVTSLPIGAVTTAVDAELVLSFAAQSQNSTFTVNNGEQVKVQMREAQTNRNIAGAIAAGVLTNAGSTGTTTFTASATGHYVTAVVTVTPSNTVPDTTPPSLTISVPAADGTVSNATTTQAVTGQATDNVGVASVTVKVNSGSAVAQSLDGSGNFSTTVNLSVGANAIKTVATDTSSLTRSVTRNITRSTGSGDNTGPVIAFTTPPGDPTNVDNNTTSQVIAGTATDSSGISSLTIDGNEQTPLGAGGAFSYSLTGLAVGSNTVTIVATDNSANLNPTTKTLTIVRAATGGGGGGGVRFGWGEGHMDGFGSSDLADAIYCVTQIFPQPAQLRTDLVQDSVGTTSTFGPSNWAKMNTLFNQLAANNVELFGTFHLKNTSPTPAAGAMSNWGQMCTSGMEYMLKYSAGGWIMPTAIEILNEPNGPTGGNVAHATAYQMIKTASQAIRAHASANGYPISICAPGLAGSFTPFAYLTGLIADAVADGTTLDTVIDEVMFHIYFTAPNDYLTDPGSTDATHYVKSLDKARALLDSHGLQAIKIGVSEGNFKDNDFQNAWLGGASTSPFETKSVADGSGQTGAWSAEEKLPLAWDYWIQNAARLNLSRIIQFEFTDHNAYGANFDTYQDLGLCRHTSGQTVLRPKAVALRKYFAGTQTAPTCQIITPLAGTTINGNHCAVGVYAAGPSGLASVAVQVNDAGSWITLSPATGQANYSGTVTLTLGAVGTTHANKIRARAVGADAAATTTTTTDITVNAANGDTTAPVLTTTPADGSLTNVSNATTSQAVTGQATDNVGVASVTVKLNSNAPATQSLDGSGNFSTTVTGLAVGSNTVTVVATDTSNLTTTSTFTIQRAVAAGDNTPPTLVVSHPSPGTTNVGNATTSQTVDGTATDASGISSLKVNGNEQTPLGGGGAFSTSVALIVGNNPISVVAIDNSANLNQQSASFNVVRAPAGDVTGPTITIAAPYTYPATTAFTVVGNAGDSVSLTGTCTDVSGVGSLTINTVPVALDNSGNWLFGLTLGLGVNPVQFVAIDSVSNITTLNVVINLTTQGTGSGGGLIISDDLTELTLRFKERGVT